MSKEDKIPESTFDLPTLPTLFEFNKTLDKKILKLYVHDRFKGLIDRYKREDAVRIYGKCKVFNFFQREDEETVLDIFVEDLEVENQ